MWTVSGVKHILHQDTYLNFFKSFKLLTELKAMLLGLDRTSRHDYFTNKMIA